MKDSFISIFGVAGPAAANVTSRMDQLEQWLRISSLIVGLAAGLASLAWSVAKWIDRRRRKALSFHGKTLFDCHGCKLPLPLNSKSQFCDACRPPRPGPGVIAAIALSLIVLSGCTNAEKQRARADAKSDANAAEIKEQSAVLTTGIVDTLQLAPTNEPTQLALELAKQDQLLEGMPKERLDVVALLAGHKQALDALAKRFDHQGRLIQEKADLQVKLRETEARLLEMGRKYEEERNMGIVKRLRRGLKAVTILGGLAALFFFCPIAIPIAGRMLGMIVAQFPKLAGFAGVVSTKAFDGVVKGVEKAQQQIGNTDTSVLMHELSKAMDAAHKQLVRARKPIATAAVALMLCFGGSGCSQAPAPVATPKPMAGAEVSETMLNFFEFNGNVADASYLLPAESWVTNGFSRSWIAFKEALGPWTAEDNDCDDFARGAAFFAQLLHHNTPGRPAGSALAFGEFWYLQRDNRGGHAINFYLCRGTNGFRIGFFEPQTGRPVALTQEEIKSCIAWRL